MQIAFPLLVLPQNIRYSTRHTGIKHFPELRSTSCSFISCSPLLVAPWIPKCSAYILPVAVIGKFGRVLCMVNRGRGVVPSGEEKCFHEARRRSDVEDSGLITGENFAPMCIHDLVLQSLLEQVSRYDFM